VNISAAPWRKGDPPPAWPFVGVSLVLLAGLGWAISKIPPRFIPPCGFHVVTGHPCPTCGSTRAALLLLKGRPLEAFRTNPLLALVVAGLVLWVAAGAAALLLGRRLTLRFGKREPRLWWVLLLVVFLLNWWYLWRAGI
jgi:hypothetical protein